ncbi:MAG: hypothetical protein V4773_29730 [Verrucomicrobiota bacterium]
MNLNDFARFFVRFNGASFVFWAFYTAIDLPPFVRNYRLVHEVRGADVQAAEDLAAIVLKIALQLIIALVLLVKTDQVISLFAKGQWKKEPGPIS